MAYRRGYLKRLYVAFWKEFGTLLRWSVFGAVILHFGFARHWSWIVVFIIGFFAAHRIAMSVVYDFSETYFTPGRGGEISLSNPRVWTFHLVLTKTFIEEISTQLSERFYEDKARTEYCDPSIDKPVFATSTHLKKLMIEEHPKRVRIHRWVISCIFRAMPAGYSRACRPPIPV